ncbi:MAG: sensor histidine kinase [Vicinamibacterales bacterium]
MSAFGTRGLKAPRPGAEARDAHAPAASASHVAIAVADHGLGIGPEDRKHIFEPFYRGRDAVSRQIQGSGLGLNLVWRIAEAHDGAVDVASEPGRGSTFTLILPAAPAHPENALHVGLVPSQG